MRYLTLIVFFLFVSESQSQNVFFTDSQLKEAILEHDFDTNEDGEISFTEALLVDSLDLDSSQISSVTGLEKFENLKILNLSSNSLTLFPNMTLPLLEKLYLSFNQLSNIQLYGFDKLKDLSLEKNTGILSLDFKALEALEKLNIKGTGLNVVDLTGLGNLKSFGADLDIDTLRSNYGYHITASTLWQFKSVKVLDMSNHPTQTEIYFTIYSNGFNFLIAENCPNLETVEIFNLDLSGITLKNSNAIKKLKIPNCEQSLLLSDMIQGMTNIQAIAVSNIKDTDYHFLNNYKSLSSLTLSFNELDTFTLSNNASVKYLEVSNVNTVIADSNDSLFSIGGEVKNLNVNNCPKFNEIRTDQLEKIEINECEEFTDFPQGWWNPNFAYSIKEVSIKNCTSLNSLIVQWYSSKLSKLDLTGCTNLTDLKVSGNQLDTLDLSTNLKLQTLECASNPINNVDISYLPELTHLNCNTTSMEYLNLNFDHKLNYLNVNGHDSTFYVCVKDLNAINISTILPSDDSTSMWKKCAEIITNINEENTASQKTAIKAFNITGQEIPLKSRNQIMILLYDDGTYEKTFIYR